MHSGHILFGMLIYSQRNFHSSIHRMLRSSEKNTTCLAQDFPEKLTVPQLRQTSPAFYAVTIMCSLEPATVPYHFTCYQSVLILSAHLRLLVSSFQDL